MNTTGIKIVRIIELPNDLNLVAIKRLLGKQDITIADQLVIGLAKDMPKWRDQSIQDLEKHIIDAQAILDSKKEARRKQVLCGLGDRIKELRKIGIEEIVVDGITIDI